MLTQKETAEASTSTVAIGALAGASMSKPSKELTMVTHITARPPGATDDMTLQVSDLLGDVTLEVTESRQRPLNPGEPMKFDTTLDGQPVVTRSTTPFFDSCRVLAAFGFTGKVEFRGTDGGLRMTMQITEGAKLTVKESPSGPQLRKIDANSVGKAGLGGDQRPADSQAAELLDGGVL